MPKSLPELAYGGTEKQVGAKPGDMMMIADESLLASGYEIIVTNPMQIEDGDLNAKGMMFLATFKGIVNNDGRLKAITLVMLPEMIPDLIKNLRKLYSEIPIEYR